MEPRPDPRGPGDRLARAALWTFGLVVVGWGLSGVLAPEVWLHHPLLLGLPPVDPARRPTFLNELRFLEARELGVGIMAIGLRDAILTQRRANLVFLLAVFAAPASRALACARDGLPSPAWLAFMASEIAMAVALAVLTRDARRAPDPRS